MTKSKWSQIYFEGLTQNQHDANNHWFDSMRRMLKDNGKLFVPMLNKVFNKQGEEINE